MSLFIPLREWCEVLQSILAILELSLNLLKPLSQFKGTFLGFHICCSCLCTVQKV